MAASSTDDLLEDSKCIECIPYGLQLGVLISIFAKLAGVSADPNTLIENAKCLECIPNGLKLGVLISLAEQIVAGGGGGGGSTCLSRSVGPPVAAPAAGCQTAIDIDDAGNWYWYDTVSAAWIAFA